MFATVIGGVASTNLTPASGGQDHTTSPSASAPFVKSASTSTASRPASLTIRIRPSVGRDGGGYRFDLGQARSGIFLQTGLDRPNHIDRAQQIARLAQWICCFAEPVIGRAFARSVGASQGGQAKPLFVRLARCPLYPDSDHIRFGATSRDVPFPDSGTAADTFANRRMEKSEPVSRRATQMKIRR